MGTGQIFDVITIIYALGAGRLAWGLMRKPRLFWDLPLSGPSVSLPYEIAFFLVHPFVVPIHELGHAIAVWAFGGTVLDYQWRIFWGYVQWSGSVDPVERWWIATAGSLAAAAVGLAFLLIAFRARTLKPMIRAIVLRAAVFELAFTFIAYPLFSYAGFGGDWLTILDFKETPIPSTLALAAVGIVGVALFLGRERIDGVLKTTLAPRGVPRFLQKEGWLMLGVNDGIGQLWHPEHGGVITVLAAETHKFGPAARSSMGRALRRYESIPGGRRGG